MQLDKAGYPEIGEEITSDAEDMDLDVGGVTDDNNVDSIGESVNDLFSQCSSSCCDKVDIMHQFFLQNPRFSLLYRSRYIFKHRFNHRFRESSE